MKLTRSSGILMHISSLPGSRGIGDLDSAPAFIDFLAASKQKYWQILPFGPTGYGDSPYQCLSSFAGNPLFIGLATLCKQGLLEEADLASVPDDESQVHYGAVIPQKMLLLQKAFHAFDSSDQAALNAFRLEQSDWLDDYALFSAIKKSADGCAWTHWPAPLRDREEAALAAFKSANEDAINFEIFLQWCFATQWQQQKAYANSKGVEIIGDLPIFTAHDSADVWANRELFKLDETGHPSVVAGVPPDYFSATGQLWGNPIYTWDTHKQTGYAWWQQRIKHTLALCDVLRLDHFRGFIAHWEVPAQDDTAMNGKWVSGPAADFFQALHDNLGELPIIAEDLGQITQEVEDVKNAFDLPGMLIFQFAFGTDPNAPKFKPHNFHPNSVAYTGTHDNDTTVGWWESQAGVGSVRSAEEIASEIDHAKRYLDTDGHEIHKTFIKRLYASVAKLVIVPMQDVLGLGSDSRMNKPASSEGNWSWRLNSGQLADLANRTFLAEIAETYERGGNAPK